MLCDGMVGCVQRSVLYREDAGPQRAGRDHTGPAVHHTDRQEQQKQQQLASKAEPKLSIFGSGSTFVHNFGSGADPGSSSSSCHILTLKTVLIVV